jgi:hypothetical protein
MARWDVPPSPGFILNVTASGGIKFEAQTILRARTNRLEAVSLSKL